MGASISVPCLPPRALPPGKPEAPTTAPATIPPAGGKHLWIHLGDSKFPLVLPEVQGGTSETGLRLWVSCLVLTGYLLEQGASLVRDLSVVELGAGVSPLPAIAAAKAGASSCLVTDYLESLTALAQTNLIANAVHQTASVGLLDWEDVRAKAASGTPQRSWEVVLFADAVYSVEQGTLLAHCLQATVAPQGKAIGAISALRVGCAEFVRTMARLGFVAENIPISEALRTQIDGGAVLGSSTSKSQLAATIEGLPAANCFLVIWRKRDSGLPTPPDDTEAVWQGLAGTLSDAEANIRMSEGFEVWE
jgi:hypothetical protein